MTEHLTKTQTQQYSAEIENAIFQMGSFGLWNEKKNDEKSVPKLIQHIIDGAIVVLSNNVLEKLKNNFVNDTNTCLNEELITRRFNCIVTVRIHKLQYLKSMSDSTQCYCTVEIADKEFKTLNKTIKNLNFSEV